MIIMIMIITIVIIIALTRIMLHEAGARALRAGGLLADEVDG